MICQRKPNEPVQRETHAYGVGVGVVVVVGVAVVVAVGVAVVVGVGVAVGVAVGVVVGVAVAVVLTGPTKSITIPSGESRP